ncbi:hypothetical protein ACIQFU_37845 [Streptomyces sp. NPDC093065]
MNVKKPFTALAVMLTAIVALSLGATTQDHAVTGPTATAAATDDTPWT